MVDVRSGTFRAALLAVACCLPLHAEAQRLTVGGQMVTTTGGPFDHADVGLGVRVSWRLLPMLEIEGEANLYPGDFPDDPAFSGSRMEVYGGATVGPWLGRVRPFARVRPGLLVSSEAPEPFACILIYPPPLACVMASGQTMAALDVGGGVEMAMTPRTLLRVDAGDRVVRYPGPSLNGGRRRDGAFFGHQLRLAVGAGVRF